MKADVDTLTSDIQSFIRSLNLPVALNPHHDCPALQSCSNIMNRHTEMDLTVLVLTYNHEATIARAIDSVLSQTTDYRFVIWLCDDCSTDQTTHICRHYAEQYPDRIQLMIQPANTKGKHFQRALSQVKSRYFAIVEGDDYWCSTNKIQTGLDILESHPRYCTFAHDTLYDNSLDGTRKSLVHDIHNQAIRNPVTLADAPYLHTSARIHRNVVDFAAFELDMIFDIQLFYLFLDKGDLYYHDEIMSVYCITGTGMWTQLDQKNQDVKTTEAMWITNRLLNYRHDIFFSNKVTKKHWLSGLKRLAGMKWGWSVYLYLLRKRAHQ